MWSKTWSLPRYVYNHGDKVLRYAYRSLSYIIKKNAIVNISPASLCCMATTPGTFQALTEYITYRRHLQRQQILWYSTHAVVTIVTTSVHGRIITAPDEEYKWSTLFCTPSIGYCRMLYRLILSIPVSKLSVLVLLIGTCCQNRDNYLLNYIFLEQIFNDFHVRC